MLTDPPPDPMLYQDQFPPAAKLRHVLLDWTGLRVLDLGANLGALGVYALERGAASYVGHEANAAWADAGRQRYGHVPGWTLHTGNARAADLGGADILCALGLFHHMRDDDVRHILRTTTARRVLIEQPMGGAFQHYLMRPQAWYRAELEEAGFGQIERFPYGFAYPVERAIFLADRAPATLAAPLPAHARFVDVTACAPYWAALAPRPAAIAALVLHDDPEPYLAWWRSRMPYASPEAAGARVAFMRAMIAEIRAHGYDADRWRSDHRGYDASNGFGPISVRPRGGTYVPWDGAHRACVLRALGLPVLAMVHP